MEAKSILSEYDKSVKVQKVVAGKFRRYNHLSKLQHLTIPSIILPNIRDLILVIFGVGQSLFRMVLWRPDVIFAKGGYVCLPVGVAAWALGIPVVIHDSDSRPGLTNKLMAPRAKRIATGMPLDNYEYPKSKTTYVGTPVSPDYREISDKKRSEIKEGLGFEPSRPMTLITGGGQGAKSINDNVVRHLGEILNHTNVVLVSGSAQYDEINSLVPQDDPRFILKDFVSSGMSDLVCGADLVISRAGATTLLELAAAARPTIVIPSKRLVWQIEHVRSYENTDAVLVLDEDKFDDPDDNSLVVAIKKILNDKKYGDRLSRNLHKHAKPNAASEMAQIIIESANGRA